MFIPDEHKVSDSFFFGFTFKAGSKMCSQIKGKGSYLGIILEFSLFLPSLLLRFDKLVRQRNKLFTTIYSRLPGYISETLSSHLWVKPSSLYSTLPLVWCHNSRLAKFISTTQQLPPQRLLSNGAIEKCYRWPLVPDDSPLNRAQQYVMSAGLKSLNSSDHLHTSSFFSLL